MDDEWTVAEGSLWIFRYLTAGDCGKTQKPEPQNVPTLSAVYKTPFSIPSKTFVGY
jgi:hypothetical protein